jgi:hypothetical protein
LAILFLLCSAVDAFAQIVTDIDVRGRTATQPRIRMVGGSGTGPGDQKSLEAVLTVPDPSELIPGKPFDFELLVTNRGKKTVVIPQSLDWDDVNIGGPDWRYRVANVVLQVAPDGGHQRGHIDLGLQFYGSDEKPLTELVLAPGDGVRIFGTGQLPVSMNINGYPILKGKLSGSFWIHTECLHTAPTATVPDGFSSDGRTIFSAESEPRYPVNLQSAR